MKETAMDVNERKIRNGIRKQRQKIEREQQKVWDRLKDTTPSHAGMTIERKMVYAQTRKLEAGWTLETDDE